MSVGGDGRHLCQVFQFTRFDFSDKTTLNGHLTAIYHYTFYFSLLVFKKNR